MEARRMKGEKYDRQRQTDSLKEIGKQKELKWENREGKHQGNQLFIQAFVRVPCLLSKGY
jgi:hypothetical protein